MDSVPPAVRRRIMRANRSRDTGPERLLKAALRQAGIRFRSWAALPGTPDVVLAGRRVAVFVDGDFWHGRRWFRDGVAPRTNQQFWIAKFERNRRRDRRVDRALRRGGWAVRRIWETDLAEDPDAAVRRIASR